MRRRDREAAKLYRGRIMFNPNSGRKRLFLYRETPATAPPALAPPLPAVRPQITLLAAGIRAAVQVAGAWRLLFVLVVSAALVAGCLPGSPSDPRPQPATLTATPELGTVLTPTAAEPVIVTSAPGTATQAAATATPSVTPEPASDNAPELIQFMPGATTVTISGVMSGQSQKVYLLRAEAGQTVSITLTSAAVSVLFHLHGEDDGVDYKHLLDGKLSWQGVLPISQNYVLTLDAIGDGERSYTLEVSLVTGGAGGGPLHPVVDGATG
jgi:hypothetical protein